MRAPVPAAAWLALLSLAAPSCHQEDLGALADQTTLVSTDARAGESCADEGASVECYSESPVIDSTGRSLCLVGARRCVGGVWGGCGDLVSQAAPASGVARQAVLGSGVGCNGCDPRCIVTSDQPSGLDLDADLLGNSGCEGAPDGGVRIGSGGTAAVGRYAWIAHTGNDTVSKVDLTTRAVKGRYRVGIKGITNNPSRTAVDAAGYAYVAQRAFGQQGTLTKIASEPDDCVERNGTAGIQTSDGTTLLGWPGYADQDECIIWQVAAGPVGGIPRSLALDAKGRVWVGLHNSRRFYVFAPSDGSLLGTVNTSGCSYGAAIDASGNLWSADGDCDGGLDRIDTTVDVPSNAAWREWVDIPGGRDAYGIAVDSAGRVFTGIEQAGTTKAGGVQRYDPGSKTWLWVDTPDSNNSTGVTVDATGLVYVAHPALNAVTVHDPETLVETYRYNFGPAGMTRPYGLCPDFDGKIWVANNGTADAAILDPVAHTITKVPLSANSYTYSDFTGFGFLELVSPSAAFHRDYDSADAGCPDLGVTTRQAIRWEATMPPGSSLTFYGRTADSQAGLDSATEVQLGATTEPTGIMEVASVMESAVPPQDPTLRFFRLRVVLNRGDDSPVVTALGLVEYCIR